MQGLSLRDLKKHPALIPLYACFFAGAFMATAYGIRLAVYSPEVTWNCRKNPEPFQEYANKQYKFYSSVPISELPCPAPKY